MCTWCSCGLQRKNGLCVVAKKTCLDLLGRQHIKVIKQGARVNQIGVDVHLKRVVGHHTQRVHVRELVSLSLDVLCEGWMKHTASGMFAYQPSWRKCASHHHQD